MRDEKRRNNAETRKHVEIDYELSGGSYWMRGEMETALYLSMRTTVAPQLRGKAIRQTTKTLRRFVKRINVLTPRFCRLRDKPPNSSPDDPRLRGRRCRSQAYSIIRA